MDSFYKYNYKTPINLLLLAVALVFAGVVGNCVYNVTKNVGFRKEVKGYDDISKAIVKNNISSYITVSGKKYKNYDGKINVRMSVENKTIFFINNVRIKVTYLRKNGIVRIVKLVDFGKMRPETKENSLLDEIHDGDSVNYEIIAIQSDDLGINYSKEVK